jgi:hypothetical protein
MRHNINTDCEQNADIVHAVTSVIERVQIYFNIMYSHIYTDFSILMFCDHASFTPGVDHAPFVSSCLI